MEPNTKINPKIFIEAYFSILKIEWDGELYLHLTVMQELII